MADGRILKIVKLQLHISVKNRPKFDKVWYTISDIEPDYSHVTKN